MKFAICNEIFGQWPHQDVIEFVAGVGYAGIEVAPFTLGSHVDEIDLAMRQQFRDLVESNGMQVVGLHWLLAETDGYHLTSPDQDTRRRTLDYLKRLTILCRDLGGDVMVFGSPQQRNLVGSVSVEQGNDFAVDVFEQLLPTLEANHVTLAIEPLGPEETNFILTAGQAWAVCRRLDSPWVKVHLDVKAMATESAPIEGIIAEHADHVAHFHANDPNRLGPGMGEVDFVPIFKALAEANYGRWVSVEVFDFSPGPDHIAKESLRYMKSILSQVS